MATRRSIAGYCLASLLIAGAGTLAACGSSSSTQQGGGTNTAPKATATLAVSISESGKTAKYAVPAKVAGGLVSVQLTDHGKAPHAAQLVRIVGNHAPLDALKILGGNSKKIPDWIHAEGGVGPIAPGSTASAKVSLPAGNYIVVDAGGPGGNGPPAYAPFTVSAGTPGTLPTTPVTITAANPGKDRYRWQISGTLRSGSNDVTFVSKGRATLHEISAVRITGNPTKAQIIKALNSNGPTPSFVDTSTFAGTAALDNGKSLAGPLRLAKAGKYVLLCHLTDRDGGKPHFVEGLLTTVTVK